MQQTRISVYNCTCKVEGYRMTSAYSIATLYYFVARDDSTAEFSSATDDSWDARRVTDVTQDTINDKADRF